MKDNNNIEKFYTDLINKSNQDPLLWNKIEENLSKNELFNQYNQILERGALVPPASLWNSIESSLENNAIKIQYKEKIFINAPLPPVSLWNNIESTLENTSVEAQYKEKVFTNAPQPPASLWNDIESTLENTSVETQYKEKIFTNAPLPPESLWDNINGSLSSSSTWERIVHSLNKRDKNIKWIQASANLMTTGLALLMLFYGIVDLPYGRKIRSQKGSLEAIRNSNTKGLTSTTNEYSHEETSITSMKNKEIVNNAPVSNVIPSYIKNNLSNNSNSTISNSSQRKEILNTTDQKQHEPNNSSKENNNINDQVAENTVASTFTSNENATVSESNNQPLQSSGKQFDLEKIKPLDVNYISSNISDSLRTQFSDFYEEPKGTFFASVYVNNPWINSSRTIQNFTNKTLNYNQLYLTFGAGFGYERYFNKFNLSASVNYNRLGQKYVSYQEGVTVNNQVTLNYLTLRMCISPNNKPFYGGLYYGMLTEELYELVDKDYQVNFNKNPEVDHYFKNDFGVTMGIEHTVSVLNRPIKFNASLSHSVFSLYTGNMHRDFNKSYNLYLSLGFRYCFR